MRQLPLMSDVGGCCKARREMARHTTFRYCLDPTADQLRALARHAGAARFAFNQCLPMVKEALDVRIGNPSAGLPWTGYDLINSFNAWKKTSDAGRVFAVGPDGSPELIDIGLPWRTEVCQQVFEEAAIDCGRALKAWSDSRNGKRNGRQVGFPQFKRKVGSAKSFRLRNKQREGRRPAIRLGDSGQPRSVTLPGLGSLRVHDDTRRIRRMLKNGRARILFATVSQHGGRWWVSLNVEAADFHQARRRVERPEDDHGDWVGVDRGLSTLVVAATADGTEVLRIECAPKALVRGLQRQRRLAKSLARKEKGANNRRAAAARLARHHIRIANVRRNFLHAVSNRLVKTHDRLVLEDLNIVGLMRNRHLARSIGDSGWGELARQLTYKAEWWKGQILVADRWYPSSKRCSRCGQINRDLKLADRVFRCQCGHRADRDRNAAANLAQWAAMCTVLAPTPDPQAGGRVNNACRRDGAGRHQRAGETVSNEVGTGVHRAPRCVNRRRPRRAVPSTQDKLFDTL
jgi:putative transposase